MALLREILNTNFPSALPLDAIRRVFSGGVFLSTIPAEVGWINAKKYWSSATAFTFTNADRYTFPEEMAVSLKARIKSSPDATWVRCTALPTALS